MDTVNWIKITERAREGIKIINAIGYDVFKTLLIYVHKNMNPEKEDHDSLELEALEKIVGVPRVEFLLLIKTLSYILKRTSTFIMKPTKLQSELREKLNLNDDKVDAIIKLWMKNTKPLLDKIEMNENENSGLKDIAWKLKVIKSSHSQQKDKDILGNIQLQLFNNESIDFEMNHDELVNFYNQLEYIQNELDALRSTK